MMIQQCKNINNLVNICCWIVITFLPSVDFWIIFVRSIEQAWEGQGGGGLHHLHPVSSPPDPDSYPVHALSIAK